MRVYTLTQVWIRDSQIMPFAYTTLEQARTVAERRDLDLSPLRWTEHNSHGHCWCGLRNGDIVYVIDELEVV